MEEKKLKTWKFTKKKLSGDADTLTMDCFSAFTLIEIDNLEGFYFMANLSHLGPGYEKFPSQMELQQWLILHREKRDCSKEVIFFPVAMGLKNDSLPGKLSINYWPVEKK